ncbi:cation transporter [Mycolicibacterium litorale]|uniref:Cation transporter n=1 Tax=Mycolicibacterium litorale TaxID=758802 RepID=A0A6S6PEH8_9MYCO|nr:SMR family transporter [Mycolicibacterium litorale]BCI56097.1 cation transporter [Mycolicibacterium litorale]
MTWLYLVGAIVCEVGATLSLKGAQSAPLLYGVVVAGYAGAFVCLTVVLKRGLGLGVAYGIWAASGVAATAVLSTVIFREAFTVTMGVGLVFIIVGVLLVETGSAHPDDAHRSVPEGA